LLKGGNDLSQVLSNLLLSHNMSAGVADLFQTFDDNFEMLDVLADEMNQGLSNNNIVSVDVLKSSREIASYNLELDSETFAGLVESVSAVTEKTHRVTHLAIFVAVEFSLVYALTVKTTLVVLGISLGFDVLDSGQEFTEYVLDSGIETTLCFWEVVLDQVYQFLNLVGNVLDVGTKLVLKLVNIGVFDKACRFLEGNLDFSKFPEDLF